VSKVTYKVFSDSFLENIELDKELLILTSNSVIMEEVVDHPSDCYVLLVEESVVLEEL